MKEHINFEPVEGVSIAIARSEEPGDELWQVFLINTNPHQLDNVIVVSKGYTGTGDEKVQTSVLRHVFELVKAKDHVLVEPIDPGIFHLTNEFWVSYYVNGKVFDKKFIFVPDSIITDHLIQISSINRVGVLHS
ncbi:MAG: hypothetical protein EOP51_16625 [Sphingobacteriales bacterium]|nr:MAG: hypothetical protein EOP51_16625 [Sphingobacteriales bacterium]